MPVVVWIARSYDMVSLGVCCHSYRFIPGTKFAVVRFVFSATGDSFARHDMTYLGTKHTAGLSICERRAIPISILDTIALQECHVRHSRQATAKVRRLSHVRSALKVNCPDRLIIEYGQTSRFNLLILAY